MAANMVILLVLLACLLIVVTQLIVMEVSEPSIAAAGEEQHASDGSWVIL